MCDCVCVSVADGVHYREILSLCIRHQEHLTEAAKVVGTEQVGIYCIENIKHSGHLSAIEIVSIACQYEDIWYSNDN